MRIYFFLLNLRCYYQLSDFNFKIRFSVYSVFIKISGKNELKKTCPGRSYTFRELCTCQFYLIVRIKGVNYHSVPPAVHYRFTVAENIYIAKRYFHAVIFIRFLRPLDCSIYITINFINDGHIVTGTARYFSAAAIRFCFP